MPRLLRRLHHENLLADATLVPQGGLLPARKVLEGQGSGGHRNRSRGPAVGTGSRHTQSAKNAAKTQKTGPGLSGEIAQLLRQGSRHGVAGHARAGV